MKIIHIVLGKSSNKSTNKINNEVFQLAAKQIEYGNEVSVWEISNQKNSEKSDFEIINFNKSINPFKITDELKNELLKQNAIFHIHGGWIPLNYSISKLLTKNNKSFVFSPHNAYYIHSNKESSLFSKYYFNLFEKGILNNASRIHCIGRIETCNLRLLYKNKKTIITPYGYENEQEVDYTNTSKNSKSIIFGFEANLEVHIKSLEIILKAFEKFVHSNGYGNLYIITSKNEKKELKKIIKNNNVMKNIFIFDNKKENEKANVLKEIDVFIHPSRKESFQISVIEAASYGKPCIVTGSTSIGELISKYNAGEVIYRQNSKELERSMTTISNVIKDKNNFSAICQNAITMVKENYNWRKVIFDFNRKLYNV